ncbi:hypothetical protein ADICYQ_0870 [Cyclobacterium qasimii M12-11B]|uniref:Uncharacterized protein n=1 Tax=Cyclobacterium qasimii M12-11B TaxID=641524 RepID=S7WVT2_9BACT|nr:hypothetical protein ADICYQ_0870 [Cyclobacterium qasimii M12-11B]
MENLIACSVFYRILFDEGVADNYLLIIFRGINKVGYQALLY